jgi:hypothetical protein
LTRIEARACSETNMSLAVVPGSVSFIANNAFPLSCTVTLVGSDCDGEFRASHRGGHLG